MPECGSQIVLCDLPVHFDNYKGCSHGCKYCFAQRKADLNHIEKKESAEALANFIRGKRDQTTNWCDWSIPIHWGGLSDPFQPIEKSVRSSLECLKILADTYYPFIVSTKGRLITEPEYLNQIRRCNAVVQISMASPAYDKLEPGAPPYEERMKMVSTLSNCAKRVIVRIQPYMPEILDDVINNMPRLKTAGVYGVTIEGMKFIKKQPGLIKVGADFVFPVDLLKSHYQRIKAAAHVNGLKFYCAENRLRTMGDSMTCCGIDGLEGFRPNTFNLCHLLNGEKLTGTEQMNKVGTANCFKAIHQDVGFGDVLKNNSLQSMMLLEYANKSQIYKSMFGK